MEDQTRMNDIKRWQANLHAELEGAALYQALAAAEKDERRAAIFRQLADAEAHHAAHWAQKLRDAGVEPEKRPLGLRTRLLSWVARRFGARTVLPLITALEVRDQGMYQNQPDAGHLSADERVHARVLAELAPGGGRGLILKTESWHRPGGGSSLRASVFGLNDGLVSNLSLVMGVAGAGPEPRFILLAGIAGLLAGAFSMGAGEYISMRAQREFFERQISREREELAMSPEEEEQELSLIYQAKGIGKAQADEMASQLMRDPAAALDTLAREELGLDPSELGSPWGAAISSFLLFALGALVPVLPFAFGLSGVPALVASALVSGLALFSFGAALSIFTGRSPIFSGARMLVIGAAAATVTFLIGKLVGITTAG